MKLKPPTKENLEIVRQWRNECMESLRTPTMLTKEQQENFYESLPTSNHRYYELWFGGKFVGLGGITYIQWENRFGEISLIINPEFRARGLGQLAVAELYRTAFNELNLNMVFGECYFCNDDLGFWQKLTREYDGNVVDLPARKYWDGEYWESMYFSVTKEQYEIQASQKTVGET